jgi:rod shape-determining protein MreC
MNRRSSLSLLALILLLVGTALLALNQAGFLTPAQSLILRPMGEVQSWLASRSAVLRELLTAPRDVATLRAQIAELQAENARLEQELVALREQTAELEVLSALVDFARSQPQSRYLAASVIGRDVSPFLRWVIISAGSDDGIIRGMPVVTDQGLVGRVVEVFATVSRVQLITDPEAAVNIQLQASRAEGVLAPQANGELRIELLEQSAAVEEGDLALTSGLGGSYPTDIPVGQVISVRKRDFELFQEAVISPAVDFDGLEVVLVITSFRPLPLGELSP